MLLGGTHATVASGFGWEAAAWGTVRTENVLSCFWRISLADSGDEAITVVIEPSFKVMSGPWILASSASDWGLEPRSRSEPIIGRPVGPGGCLFLVDLEVRINGLMKNQQKIKEMKKRRMGSSILLSSILG